MEFTHSLQSLFNVGVSTNQTQKKNIVFIVMSIKYLMILFYLSRNVFSNDDMVENKTDFLLRIIYDHLKKRQRKKIDY